MPKATYLWNGSLPIGKHAGRALTVRGEALLAQHATGELAGIGGLTIEPVLPGALRMRRFYVRARFRRAGIGRTLATALLERARITGLLVSVNAAPASAPFWESLDFVPDMRDGHTHLYRGFC